MVPVARWQRASPRTARRWSWRRYAAIAGAGALVSVGYVDPGNWATDVAAGSRFAYAPLSVVVASGLAAMLFQCLSARLGIATGKDLAELTREAYPRAAWPIWCAAEIAIIATDVAEVLGSALALSLLWRVPLTAGVALTGLDVLVLMSLERLGSRAIPRVVEALLVVVAAALGYELAVSRPTLAAIAGGLLPDARVFTERDMLLSAVAIVGATVMPHNLYLHSSLVRRGRAGGEAVGAASFATLDAVVSLAGATCLNAALVVVAAAAFHDRGRSDVADIADAHRLLAPLLGSTAAPVVFALALLAAGQSATVTATLAGQVVMSGFLAVRWSAWKRRLVTRACAMVPALVLLFATAERNVGRLLVGSQVVLSLGLPLAIVPLMRLTSDPRRMGALVSPTWVRTAGWTTAGLIVAANAALLLGLAAR